MNTTGRRRPMSEINVVPYIDVMLVLLVIFMITAPLMTQGINVKLPNAAARAISSDEQLPIVVSVNQSGQMFLNISEHPKQVITSQDLMTEVAATLQLAQRRHIQRQIYVKGDGSASYSEVVNAMALLQKAGADQVGLLTQPGS
ncbi:MAG: protein TolR [Gammaproteobacteria bacterium RIFCSPHIGHO2_12_FULL_41_15]|nr:MAG: protein TolR [Gammaproteobacteria bacterium RIFCSPHIGHO2_12_FULL_41_15]